VIALDIPPDEVHAIYREYLELNGMYDVLQIYDQIRYSSKYSLPSFLRLHGIVNDLGMGEQQIINVLDLANHNQLEYLQDKVEYLRTENNLELKKTECTNHVVCQILSFKLIEALVVSLHYLQYQIPRL